MISSSISLRPTPLVYFFGLATSFSLSYFSYLPSNSISFFNSLRLSHISNSVRFIDSYSIFTRISIIYYYRRRLYLNPLIRPYFYSGTEFMFLLFTKFSIIFTVKIELNSFLSNYFIKSISVWSPFHWKIEMKCRYFHKHLVAESKNINSHDSVEWA